MTLVRILATYDASDLMRQSPNHGGIWNDIEFTLDPVEQCDYVIVLNGASQPTTVNCPPEHIWSIMHEPPVKFRKPWHINPSYSFRMFTTDVDLYGSEYVHSQPAMPWHIKQDYDFLLSFKAPQKTRKLSWITSTLRLLKGHRERMGFLDEIQGKLEFDLIATYEYYLHKGWESREKIRAEQAKLGFVCVEDKWGGLEPYQYSLAIENYSNSLYWSEKLIDSYLAWCMPIYYGCTRITDYFPAESLIQIDIHQPEAAIAKIEEAIANDSWRRNLDAIAYARELILNRYQLFPFFAKQIATFESEHGQSPAKQITIQPRTFSHLSIWRGRIRERLISLVRRL